MIRTAFLILAGLALFQPAKAAEDTGVVTIFAAASLTSVITDIAAAFPARLVFGSSAALARQIEQGAPADVFISANPQWISYLSAQGMIDAGSRRAIAGNRLVLAVAKDASSEITAVPDHGRMAIADPGFVPAGRYAKEALTTSGQWDSVSKRAVFAPDVRAALAWIARGEVASGIVYATDAEAEPSVRVGYVFPSQDHSPIIYQAAAVAGAEQPEAAARFLGFLKGRAGQQHFARHGFLPPPGSAN